MNGVNIKGAKLKSAVRVRRSELEKLYYVITITKLSSSSWPVFSSTTKLTLASLETESNQARTSKKKKGTVRIRQKPSNSTT